MEDVLEVYHRPYDPGRPQVCLDETSKQLVAESRPSVAMRPGRCKRVDPEYRRCGVTSVFMLSEPLAGKRYVRVRPRRTRIDFAEVPADDCPRTAFLVVASDSTQTVDQLHEGAGKYLPAGSCYD